jgi:alkyl sulfatase BDS1-like metallo-beta-lactamase superfamily hydrolase
MLGKFSTGLLVGAGIIALTSVTATTGFAQTQPKPATAATIAANKALAETLNFDDKQDFEDATRGLIDAPATLTIKNDKGDVVWDLETYKQYIGDDKPAPDTVNPASGAMPSST